MKKNKKSTSILTYATLFLLFSAQKVFADLGPPGDWDRTKRLEPSSNSFFDLLQPQYIIIGIIVLIVVIFSFWILFKMRKK